MSDEAETAHGTKGGGETPETRETSRNLEDMMKLLVEG